MALANNSLCFFVNVEIMNIERQQDDKNGKGERKKIRARMFALALHSHSDFVTCGLDLSNFAREAELVPRLLYGTLRDGFIELFR